MPEGSLVPTPGAIGLLSDALDHVEANDQIRAVVVSGRPGFDLDILMVGGKPRDQLVGNSGNFFGRLFTPPLPVVGACTETP